MASSAVAGKVAKQMAKVAAEVKKAESVAVKNAALEAKKIHLAEIRAASGGDLHLSGVGKSGARLGVSFSVKGAGKDTTALVRATGPLHLLEHKSRSHTILPRGVGRARGRGAAARRAAKQDLYSALFGGGGFSGATPLNTPFGPRFRVNHPGVQNPRRPWKRGAVKAVPMVTRKVRSAFSDAWSRGLR